MPTGCPYQQMMIEVVYIIIKVIIYSGIKQFSR